MKHTETLLNTPADVMTKALIDALVDTLAEVRPRHLAYHKPM